MKIYQYLFERKIKIASWKCYSLSRSRSRHLRHNLKYIETHVSEWRYVYHGIIISQIRMQMNERRKLVMSQNHKEWTNTEKTRQKWGTKSRFSHGKYWTKVIYDYYWWKQAIKHIHNCESFCSMQWFKCTVLACANTSTLRWKFPHIFSKDIHDKNGTHVRHAMSYQWTKKCRFSFFHRIESNKLH